ncbi:MAG TPA: Gfo/Idh/MocA family oxidoreductase [Firmicutes bacterium]|nr:Gfo/Idh/MocA family oxidoreductase [Bacillota bacterium]
MSTKKLKVGIIGTGGIANGKHMPNLAKCPEVEMTAFCDLVEERAQEAAQKYGAPGSKVYTDYKELLKDESLDVVHICTPNWVHAEQAIAALEAGKHVMCEKPMAKTSAEAWAMVAAAKKSGKKLTIGYQNRHRADSYYLKQVCDAGELGEIYFAKALAVRRRGVPTWGVFLDEEKQGGGPLIDIGTHALDLTLWLMNNYEWESVTGSVFKKLRSRENAANPWGPWDPKKYTVEDSAFGFIKFKNGATVILESSWALNIIQSGEAKCILCGTEAGADFEDGLRINGEKFSRLYITKPDLKAGGVDFYAGKSESPGYIEARRWIDAILNDTDPVVLPEQAAVVTEILEAIYKSAATNKPVYKG